MRHAVAECAGAHTHRPNLPWLWMVAAIDAAMSDPFDRSYAGILCLHQVTDGKCLDGDFAAWRRDTRAGEEARHSGRGPDLKVRRNGGCGRQVGGVAVGVVDGGAGQVDLGDLKIGVLV